MDSYSASSTRAASPAPTTKQARSRSCLFPFEFRRPCGPSTSRIELRPSRLLGLETAEKREQPPHLFILLCCLWYPKPKHDVLFRGGRSEDPIISIIHNSPSSPLAVCPYLVLLHRLVSRFLCHRPRSMLAQSNLRLAGALRPLRRVQSSRPPSASIFLSFSLYFPTSSCAFHPSARTRTSRISLAPSSFLSRSSGHLISSLFRLSRY